jgi:hypothetical protein
MARQKAMGFLVARCPKGASVLVRNTQSGRGRYLEEGYGGIIMGAIMSANLVMAQRTWLVADVRVIRTTNTMWDNVVDQESLRVRAKLPIM